VNMKASLLDSAPPGAVERPIEPVG